jgi:hypothetical protein
MRVTRSALSLVLSGFALAAYATEPASPSGSPAPLAQAPVPSTPATPPSAPQPAVAPTPAQGPLSVAPPPATPAAAPAPVQDPAEIVKAAHAMGYLPRLRNGKTVYCKPDAELGTRLQHLSCYTGEEMTAVVHRSQSNQESLAQMQRLQLYEENKH